MIFRRFMAKVVDILLMYFVASFLFMAVVLIMSNFFSGEMLELFNEYMSLLKSSDLQTLYEFKAQNSTLFMQFAILRSIVTLACIAYYFGIIGKIIDGSFGKRLFKIRIKSVTEENQKLKYYIVREPLFQIVFLQLVFLVINMFTGIDLMSNLIYGLYLVLLIMKRDIWNTAFGFKL